ncbi:MAG: hypothetical protein JWO06_1199 [Bacteroidota bacterium]|nr:hypothetical protein [Bacteroidota bacterium]
MKKFSKVFLALSLLVLMAGCSKENYTKWLTSGTWTLNSYSLETKTVTSTTFQVAVANNTTVTTDVLDVLANGVETVTTTTTTVGTTTSTTVETQIYKNASTYSFTKGGTYTTSNTGNPVSDQVTTNGVPGQITNFTTAVPSTTGSTDDWAWLEDGSVKDQIQLNKYGNVMIKLSKSSMTWSYNPSSNSKNTVAQGNDNVTTNVVSTTTDTWSFSK